MCAEACAPVLRERAFERGGREFGDGEVEGVAMSSEPLERPREVLLHWYADGAARGDDAEEHARAMRALAAAGEEHVQTQLRDVLELALGRRVIDGHVGIVDESVGCSSRTATQPA